VTNLIILSIKLPLDLIKKLTIVLKFKPILLKNFILLNKLFILSINSGKLSIKKLNSLLIKGNKNTPNMTRILIKNNITIKTDNL
jgi:hypothetical protein